MELFELRSIRTLIDYQWPDARDYTKMYLKFPFAFYLVLYWTYTNYVSLLTRETGHIYIILSQIFLIIFSLYFLLNEVYQMRQRQFLQYISSPWNYIDLTPPMLILLTVSYELISRAKSYSWE